MKKRRFGLKVMTRNYSTNGGPSIAMRREYEATLRLKMYIKSWDDFEKGAERLYLQDPLRCRYSILYIHKKGIFKVKMTDDVVCLQYKSESIQDCKRMEKFISNLLRHMATTQQQT